MEMECSQTGGRRTAEEIEDGLVNKVFDFPAEELLDGSARLEDEASSIED